MGKIFILIYLLFSLLYFVGGLIIVFHLVKFSLDKKLGAFLTFVFVVGGGILVAVNLLLFFSIDWVKVFPSL